MSSWILYVPIIVGIGTLILSIWNATHSARKDVVESRTTEVDTYISALKGQIDVLRAEFGDFKNKSQVDTDDLQRRMQACELARDDLVKRNTELEREKLNLLTQIVTAGVVAQGQMKK